MWPCGNDPEWPPGDEQWSDEIPVGAPERTTETDLATARAVAQDILWSLTGRKLGVCSTTQTFDLSGDGGCCVPGVSSMAAPSVALSRLPVHRVVEVRQNGGVVPSSGWRLTRAGHLRRRSGVWSGEVTVRYEWGVPIMSGSPLYAAVASAMGEVAFDLLQGMCGGECSLPSRISTLVRAGVTVDFAPPDEYIENGLTGLPFADNLIRSVNPGRRHMPARVFSPDIPTG